MTATKGLYHDDGSAPCTTCQTAPQMRECDACGVEGRIIDCGCKSQPRPIAADGHYTYCDDCSDAMEPAAIKSLRDAAGVAGDSEQVEICDRALNGNREAKHECARVTVEAERA